MTRVLVIAGPTAVGKTEVAIGVARRLGGEIMLGSDIKKIRDGSCFIEVEMYDDISRYASATFVLYASQAEKEG